DRKVCLHHSSSQFLYNRRRRWTSQPSLATDNHASIQPRGARIRTIPEMELLSMICRGGPLWPPGTELDLLQHTRNRIQRRAATEGRPYSTFDKVCLIRFA